MEEEYGTVRSGGKGSEELVATEANSLGVVVLVGWRVDSDVPKDSKVVYYGNMLIRRFVKQTLTYSKLGR